MSISFRKVVVSAFAALAVLGFARTAFAELPDGYRKLEFIQGDGKSAYFETDFTPCPATDKTNNERSVHE